MVEQDRRLITSETAPTCMTQIDPWAKVVHGPLKGIPGGIDWRDCEDLVIAVLSFGQQIPVLEQEGIVKTLLSAEEAGAIKADLLVAVEKSLKQPETVVAGALYGAEPLLVDLDKTHPGRVFPLVISGTQGTESGLAKLAGEINPALLNAEKQVVFVDDVVDTLSTFATFVLARRRARQEEIGLDLMVLPEKLGEAFGQDFDQSQFRTLYQTLAELMGEENVCLATVFCKNQPFLKKLRSVAENVGGEWRERQLALLEKAYPIDPSEWIIGAGLLDSGVSWRDIYENHPELKELILDLPSDLDLTLRVGANIPALLAINQYEPDNPKGKKRYKMDLLKQAFIQSLKK